MGGATVDARDDLLAARKLQPENEDVVRELSEINEMLAADPKPARAVAAGFLNREATPASCEKEQREVKRKKQEEARRLAEERRKERRARAEERQQMKGVFE